MQIWRFSGGTRAVALCLAVTVLAALGSPDRAAADRSIYFTDITGQLNLTSAQRPQVDRIVNRSERETLRIFAEHGINPNAKPVFDKLFQARHELQAVERRERNQLKAILSKDQLKTYDKLMQRIRARIIKATRNDN